MVNIKMQEFCDGALNLPNSIFDFVNALPKTIFRLMRYLGPCTRVCFVKFIIPYVTRAPLACVICPLYKYNLLHGSYS